MLTPEPLRATNIAASLVATHGANKVANLLLESYWSAPAGINFQGEVNLSTAVTEEKAPKSIFRLLQGSDGDFWCVVAQQNTPKFDIINERLQQGQKSDESLELVDELRAALPRGEGGHLVVNALLLLGEARRRDSSGKRSSNFDGLDNLAGQELSSQDMRVIIDALLASELSFPKLDRSLPIVIQDDDDPFTRLEFILPESDQGDFYVRRVEKWSAEYGGSASARVRAPTGGGVHDRVWRAFFVLFAALQTASKQS